MVGTVKGLANGGGVMEVTLDSPWLGAKDPTVSI
jgi:hypothetical protein